MYKISIFLFLLYSADNYMKVFYNESIVCRNDRFPMDYLSVSESDAESLCRMGWNSSGRKLGFVWARHQRRWSFYFPSNEEYPWLFQFCEMRERQLAQETGQMFEAEMILGLGNTGFWLLDFCNLEVTSKLMKCPERHSTQ